MHARTFLVLFQGMCGSTVVRQLGRDRAILLIAMIVLLLLYYLMATEYLMGTNNYHPGKSGLT